MSAPKPTALRRALAATACPVALTAVLAACGSSADTHGAHTSRDSHATHGTHAASPMAGMTPSARSSAAVPMPGMDPMPEGNGLSDSAGGYRMVSRTSQAPAGTPLTYRFTITGPDGGPVTGFAVDQTKRLHFYAIRSDLTGFRHLHPVMAADGTWAADLGSLRPGAWRLFAGFTPDAGAGRGKDFVLSRTLTVPGAAKDVPLPQAAPTATVDGYTVTVRGDLMAGMAHDLTVDVAKDGRPVTDLQPYLGTYAHLTAFHAGDEAFAHLHPRTAVGGDRGGPELAFHAELPEAGDWRLFLQFRASGALHTAALTLHAG